MDLLRGLYKNTDDDRDLGYFTAYKKRSVHNISEAWGIVALFTILLLGSFTHYNQHENLPKPLDETNVLRRPNSFIAERAWTNLKKITSFGPRVTGSYSNEVLTVDFLKQEIAYIKQLADKNKLIELDVQVVSGAFWNNFKSNGMTSVYRNVQNVIVKLLGEHGYSNNALLLNCHFDTVDGSSGASDDASNCVIMLEILRVLSQKGQTNKHPIIFLFNGAEERGLQGSHGFITKHKWSKDIKAFLNLESVGSAGKELLFQSGQTTAWLLKLYRKSAPFPNAQVAAEEIFHSGLVPSDTDFRIFQEYGNISGLDFAHTINGYRYHTKYDHIDYITKNILQHTGENIFELTKRIVNSDELVGAKEAVGRPQVFFDVLGLFFVTYSIDFGVVLNYGIVFCSTLLPYLSLSKVTKGINQKYLRYEIFLGFFISVISLVASNALCYGIAYDLDSAGKSMSWYASTFLCIPTYCLATIFVQCVIHRTFSRNLQAPLSLALRTQARLIGTSFFWAVLAAGLTSAKIRTAYVIVIPLLLTVVANILNGVLDWHNTVRRWLYIHLIGQILVVLWASHYYHLVLDVFIPTAGRSGAGKNPDVMIGIICSSLTFFTTSYLTPLMILFKKSKTFFIFMATIYLVTRFYFISATSYGFPYRNAVSGEPKVQRHYFTHASRTLYDKEGNIRYIDSGFWMLETDRNARKTIESLTMPEDLIEQDKNILCKNEMFCGLPLYSARQLMTGGFWLPGPAPIVRDVAHLKLISHKKPSSNLHRMNFVLTGCYLLSLQIRLKDSINLQSWSLMPFVPPATVYKKQSSYFVMLTHGLDSGPMNITLELKSMSENHNRSLLDITLVTYHMEYHKEHTSEFTKMLAKLPDWAYAVPSVAALKSWTF